MIGNVPSFDLLDPLSSYEVNMYNAMQPINKWNQVSVEET